MDRMVLTDLYDHITLRICNGEHGLIQFLGLPVQQVSSRMLFLDRVIDDKGC